MRNAWLMMVAGCGTVGVGGTGGGSNTGVAACGAATAYDASVFAALTATAWQESCGGGPLPPTCNTVELRGDGDYSWTAVSDYVERDQHGRWNFFARDDHSGIVCLDNGAVLAFSLDGDVLRFGRLGLSHAAPLAGTGLRGLLDAVTSDPLYAQMTAHAWTKANRFDLYRTAQDLSLARDGTFAASYRDGACTHGGTWSLDLDPRTTGPVPAIYGQSDPNTCDVRSGGSTAQLPASDVPRIADGRLVFYDAAYRAPDAQDQRSWLSFDGYSESVTASGTLDPELSTSAPTTFALDLENRSMLAKTLASLTIRMTPLAMTADGFTQAGPRVDLATADLTAISLAPGDHHAVQLTVMPPTSASAADIELELDFSDTQQPYTSRGDYVGTIPP